MMERETDSMMERETDGGERESMTERETDGIMERKKEMA